MVKISIDYQGTLRCEARHEPSGSTFETDAPRDNQGLGASFSPTDLLATGLGTCMATTMGIVANRHEIDLKGLRLSVIKEMTQSAPRQIARLTSEIWMPIEQNHPHREILEKAALGCPVYLSLSPQIEKPVQFHYPS